MGVLYKNMFGTQLLFKILNSTEHLDNWIGYKYLLHHSRVTLYKVNNSAY